MDLWGFLDQKNISAKNIARFESLCDFDDEEVRQLAKIVLDVATVKPHGRKRAGYLHRHHSELYSRLVQIGIYEEWIEEPEYEYLMEHSDAPWYIDDGASEYPKEVPGLGGCGNKIPF